MSVATGSIILISFPFSRVGFLRQAKNAGWSVAEKILRAAWTLVQLVIFARVLGPIDFGLLSFALSIVLMLAPLSRFGLDNVLTSELAKREHKENELLGTAFALRVFGAFGVLVLALSVSVVLGGDSKVTWIAAFVAGGLIFQSFDVIDQLFKARVQARVGVFVAVAQVLVSACFVGLLALTNAPFWLYGSVFLIDALSQAAGYAIAYRLLGKDGGRWTFVAARANDLWLLSWPVLVSGIFVAIYLRVDQIFLQMLLGSEAVGQYSAASKLWEGWNLIPVAVCAALLPALVSAKQSNPSLYEERVVWLFRAMVFIPIVVAGVLSAEANPIVAVLYGHAYSETAGVLSILAWSGPFTFFGVASSTYLLIEGRTVLSAQRTAVGAIASIVLNATLIPVYGLAGAAYASVTTFAIASFFLFHDRKGRRCLVLFARAITFKRAE